MSEKMTTSEPTTGEIVRNFRGAHIFGITQALENRIADRLESQEATIAALTARAEQAEEREKAMIDFMYAYCQFCEHHDTGEEEEPCCSCENVTHDGRECKWQLLELPQEGEGERCRVEF